MSATPDGDIARLRAALAASPALGAAPPPGEPEVEVVVPIYDAYAETAACIESVARRTDRPFGLTLINDGSRDPRISALLAGLAGAAPGLRVVDRRDNQGFVRTANEGLALARPRDVVLLNSDTVVSRGWLERLVEVARSRPDVATVTPLTNDGTLCSVPEPFVGQPLPEGYDVESFAALVERVSMRTFPEVPTGVGFCLYVTRRALDAVGVLDADTFGRGYGEENDLCQRAIRAGLVNLIADHAFVYHAGSASFGKDNGPRIQDAVRKVEALHPTYAADIQRLIADHPLRLFHRDLRESLPGGRPGARRVLHLLHDGGGTEKHARELCSIPEPSIVSLLLRCDGRALAVEEWHRGARLRALRLPLPRPLEPAGPLVGQADTLADAGYRQALEAACRLLEVDLIHVHHLINNTLDVASVARDLGIPYVMTLHDYYVICPRYTLLDPRDAPCQACPTGCDERAAAACMASRGRPASYLAQHQRRMEAFLRGAAALLTPSERARAVVLRRYPGLAIRVVEHGHDAATRGARLARRGLEAPIDFRTRTLEVAIIGGLNAQKGIHVLRAILRANRRPRTVFHFYGITTDPEIMTLEPGRLVGLEGAPFVYHGPYAAADIARRLVDDRMHVGIQPAIWEETFSYTVSELAAAGIPVIAGDLGAQAERIRRSSLGWVVADIRDPRQTLAILDRIIDAPGTLEAAAAQMRIDEALRPIEAMWDEHRALYLGLAPAPAAAGARRAPLDRRYVTLLAERAADAAAPRPEAPPLLPPRVAGLVASTLRRVPFLWPVVAKLRDVELARRRRRRAP